jgi:dTDP-4-amino-4,6-dideoxygalactose transaminase
MPVHLYGQMADMDPIMEVAARHNLHVIEDAAQAIGAEYKGRRAGSIGHFGCFSFFPSKNLGGSGMAAWSLRNDERWPTRRLLRNHGAEPKYYHKVVGGNFRLDALQAAMLRVKLTYLDGWTARPPAQRSRTRTSSFASGIWRTSGLPRRKRPERRHIYNQFVIRTTRRGRSYGRVEGAQDRARDLLPGPAPPAGVLRRAGLSRGQPAARELAANETLALPIYPELTEEMQAAVVGAVAAAYD